MKIYKLPSSSEIISRLDFRPLLIKIMFPAPPAMDLASIEADTSDSVEDIKKKLTFEQLWKAGNRFLKENHYDLADEYFKSAIKKKNKIGKLIALRGLIRICNGDLSSASRFLSKALILEADIPEARIWLAYVRLRENKLRGVSHQLKYLKKNSHLNKEQHSLILQIEANVELLKEEEGKAEEKLIKAINLNESEDKNIAQSILAYLGFKKGLYKSVENNFKEAIKTWISYASITGVSWHGVPEIYTYFQNISNDDSFVRAYAEIKEKLDKKSDAEEFYWYICLSLLKLHLLPEFFEEYSDLKEREEFWKNKIKGTNTYPYAHFRYALTLLYSNRLKESYEELLYVREEIPSSKYGYFKIESVIEWVRSEIDYRDSIGL